MDQIKEIKYFFNFSVPSPPPPPPQKNKIIWQKSLNYLTQMQYQQKIDVNPTGWIEGIDEYL